MHVSQYGTEGGAFKTPGQIKAYKAWNDLWKTKWKEPWNTRLFEHGTGNIGSYIQQTYWLLSVIERAGSTDPEKVIKVWEGDSYTNLLGNTLTMRGCDHKVIQDLYIEEFVPPARQKESFNIPPFFWYEGASSTGPSVKVPARLVLPAMDRTLDRCKGKSEDGG
jgi:branched-chain amino acid transport system substrate-binding protein